MGAISVCDWVGNVGVKELRASAMGATERYESAVGLTVPLTEPCASSIAMLRGCRGGKNDVDLDMAVRFGDRCNYQKHGVLFLDWTDLSVYRSGLYHNSFIESLVVRSL